MLQEGALHAEVERRAAFPPTRAPSNVLPSVARGEWLTSETSPLYKAVATVPVTTAFTEVEVMSFRALGRVSTTSVVGIERVPSLDVAVRKTCSKLLHQMRDDVETRAARCGPKAPGVETP